MVPPETPSISSSLCRLAMSASVARLDSSKLDRGNVPPAPASWSISAEDEDATITGMTRSLQRRVMALNFPIQGQACLPTRKLA